MATLTPDWWMIAVLAAIIAPAAAALPYILDEFLLDKPVTGDSTALILVPLAYIYGTPAAALVGGLAGVIATYALDAPFFEAFLVGPVLLVALGWADVLIDVVAYYGFGSRPPRGP